MAGGGDPDDGIPEDEARRDTFPDDAADEDAIEESLHSALNDLERMLDRREGEPPRAVGTGGGQAPSGDLDEDGEQYTIPLLDEVVIPGQPVTGPGPGPDGRAAPDGATDALADDEPTLRARIAARLASEVDVILQDRLEQALDQAREEIRARVRDHMDIILPEIVDELMQARRPPGER